MSNPWTPGPWRINPYGWGDVQAHGLEICTMWDEQNRNDVLSLPPQERAPTETEAKANARLIAGAPEMADWIASALRMVDGDGAPPDWDAARALLSRIRGDV